MNPHDPDELSAYALGALEAGDAARVESHLTGCADCRTELDELRKAADVLDQLPIETFVHGPPDGDLALRRALRRIRAERDRKGSPSPGPLG